MSTSLDIEFFNIIKASANGDLAVISLAVIVGLLMAVTLFIKRHKIRSDRGATNQRSV
jgi:hypothetical protein